MKKPQDDTKPVYSYLGGGLFTITKPKKKEEEKSNESKSNQG